MVLYGPPGTGKTTLARMTAEHADAAFEELSAVNAGRAGGARGDRAGARAAARRPPTIFFLDEIHRFNKAQQDALLPAVEEGLVTLVGATTENPYFEVNSALLSRAQVYELHALTAADVEGLLRRALDRGECGERGRRRRRSRSWPRARAATHARRSTRSSWRCETAARTGAPRDAWPTPRTRCSARRCSTTRAATSTTTSSRPGSSRRAGSDPDASLYYLAAMLEGGEDPRYIARRMIVLASEDIGNADPQALPIAVAAAQAVEHVGLPECQFALAQAAIYLSLAPKSDAAKRAIGPPREHIAEHGSEPAPNPLRSAAFPAARRTGRGVGYENPHAEPGHVNEQEHLPAASRTPLLRAGRSGGADCASGSPSCAGRGRRDGALATTASGGRTSPTRGEDPRIAAAIHEALGDARTVLNVGAGTGSYEPRDRAVTAVEPSAVMRAQRPPGAAPCIDARAEALPFADRSFDAAMAVLSDHHWEDRLAGLREMRRVARRAVVFQWSPDAAGEFWLTRDYLPSFPGPQAVSLAETEAALGATRDCAGADPARLPRRLPDGVLAPARGLPRSDGAGQHLGLLGAAGE